MIDALALVDVIKLHEAGEPQWKLVDCPTCDSKRGQSCGRFRMWSLNHWERVNPHTARKRAAADLVKRIGPL